MWCKLSHHPSWMYCYVMQTLTPTFMNVLLCDVRSHWVKVIRNSEDCFPTSFDYSLTTRNNIYIYIYIILYIFIYIYTYYIYIYIRIYKSFIFNLHSISVRVVSPISISQSAEVLSGTKIQCANRSDAKMRWISQDISWHLGALQGSIGTCWYAIR